MKSIIIYYSYSGNTRKVADTLAEILRTKGEVEIIELNALDESGNFLRQAMRALRRKRAEIGPTDFNLSQYDLACFGTPVWAFGPAPAMNACLDRCTGTEDKKVILFTTYGSGTGNERCLNYMQGILNKKGAKHFSRFSIQQARLTNRALVTKTIQDSLGYLNENT